MTVVLLQMGGPATVGEIRPFLESLFADPDIIQWPWPLPTFQRGLARAIAKRRAPRMAPRYEEIGGGSPILRHTEAQAANLAAELAARGTPQEVRVAMRYTAPRPSAVLSSLDPAEPLTLLPLYPHWSRATTGSSVRDFVAAARDAGHRGPIRAVRAWGEHPSYVELLAAQASEALQRQAKEAGAAHLLFSAHGLPRRYVEQGDPYPREVESTARRVAGRVGAADWSLAYQSAVGPVEWLRPYTDEQLEALHAAGAKAVTCVPLGFVSDHIETLYDVDITFARLARSRGMAWVRTPSFNGDAAFGRVLADVLRDAPTEAAA